ncbi:serine transporter [Cutibacterium acnes JCM 18918]|nr:serine transporter [Cutibacterium acnes JCM 18918]
MDTSTTTCSMQGKEYANIIKIRISTKLIPMNTLVTVDRPASMTEQEWRKAIKFDSTDWGWIIMSIGMAIGAGIVFLPVKVGLVGLWVFLVSSVIAYPAMYLFQRLFINTLAESPECKDYPSVISGYLGKNWGFFYRYPLFHHVGDLGIYLFDSPHQRFRLFSPFLRSDQNCVVAQSVLWSGCHLHHGGDRLTSGKDPFPNLDGDGTHETVCRDFPRPRDHRQLEPGERRGFPSLGYLVKQTIIMLPFTLTSILFIQSLSPMVISYRAHYRSIEVARHKALRSMNIAFSVLFITVFFLCHLLQLNHGT